MKSSIFYLVHEVGLSLAGRPLDLTPPPPRTKREHSSNKPGTKREQTRTAREQTKNSTYMIESNDMTYLDKV